MNIDVNRPLTPSALAMLYSGDAHAAESNLFFNAPQARAYVQSEAAKQGISDPETYFASLQLQKRLAATPSGAQMEAARLAGQFAPDSLPGALAARDAMWDKVAAIRSKETAMDAASQQANLDRIYPLPIRGQDPTLTPLAQAEARRQGLTPLQFTMQQRLGQNRIVGNTDMRPLVSAQVDPDEIYKHPNFQAALQTAPAQAADVFSALTGRDLASHIKTVQANARDENNFGRETLQKALAEGKATIDSKGQVLWRKLVPDPTNPGRLVLGDTFEQGDPFQRSLDKHLPSVSSDIARFADLQKIKDAETAQQTAVTQARARIPVQEPERIQTGATSIWDTIAGGLYGTGQDLGRLVTGQPLSVYDPTVDRGIGVGGSRVNHAAPLLRDNARFQQLLRTNPTLARQMILAIQARGSGAPVSSLADSDYSPITY